MAGNPVLGFLSAPTTQPVPRNLRMLGIVALVSFGISVLDAAISLAWSGYNTNAAGVGGAIGGLVFALVVTGLVLFWITWTIDAWTNGNPSATTHALVLGILAAVFGALGVLSNLVFGSLYGSGVSIVRTLLAVVLTVLSAAECYFGVMVLMGRKGTGTTTMGKRGAMGN